MPGDKVTEHFLTLESAKRLRFQRAIDPKDAIGQRRRELAHRMALGAREAAVRRMVLAQGLRLVAAGALAGLAATVPLMAVLASQLYGIAPHDLTTLCVSLICLLVTGGLACDLPARRAARLDTAAALRSE